jgi:5-formyltetrahydrofolate cyclo-ligase
MKAVLRREMKARRAGSDPAAAASAAAQARLCAMPEFARARRVACYLAAPGEVGTDAILRACFENGKEVAVPARRGAPADYGLCRLAPDVPLRAGALGIAEPARPDWVNAADMDVIVVPGVAFDAAGRRLGHGLGCYDRLLADAGRAFKAGLAFEWQVVPAVPAGGHDVAMDAVVTERTIYGAGAGAGNVPARSLVRDTSTKPKGEGTLI